MEGMSEQMSVWASSSSPGYPRGSGCCAMWKQTDPTNGCCAVSGSHHTLSAVILDGCTE